MYYNYHKHDHYSNLRTPDSVAKPKDYMERAKELGHNAFFTTNHGCSTDVYSSYSLCKKYDLKLIYGIEAYYVDDITSTPKQRGNHIVIIGLTRDAFEKINEISSKANKDGFYYNPRVDLKMLLTLPSKDVIITTACVNNRIFMGEDDWEQKFLLPLKNHFGEHFFLEVQNHSTSNQVEWNSQILELSDKYGIKIIHGNDSHYIYPNQSKERDIFLKGKNMHYGYEEEFTLDYPSEETIIDRYMQQGVLTREQAIESIQNTLVFDKAQDLKFDSNSKMPTIYPELSVQERYKKLEKIVLDEFKSRCVSGKIKKKDWKKYAEAIKFELNIIKETNIEEIRTADYFLINHEIINRGINKYGGTLTKTGRGSAPAFLVNNLLGFTNIDRIQAPVPLYPTRFMSKSRILDSRQFPDIDFNTADPKPFIRASKDVLGKDGCRYMVAYGKFKASGAFRLVCRAYNLEQDDYNDFGKMVGEVDDIKDKEQKNEAYEELLKHNKFGKILKYSERFIGVIDSVSPSPCSHLLLNDTITKDVGVMRVGDEICAYIDGYTADNFGFLKNDLLTVVVWKIIADTYNKIGEEIPSIEELEKELDDDVWKLYEDGITRTLNQADSNFAQPLFKKYAPRNSGEMSAMVAAIRPGFASLLDNFLNRKPYSTNTPEVDQLLESSYHYLLYQENIMAFLIWLGMPEDDTYGVIKKISKKKFTEEERIKLESRLRESWIGHIGNDDNFSQVWQIVNDASKYSFNSAHSLSVGYDSLYGANLKAKHPMNYYSVVLDIYQNDVEKTSQIVEELKYFDIKLRGVKFRHSNSHYNYDKKSRTIYKSVSSIKYLNQNVADNLYDLKNEYFGTFLDLLPMLKECGCNARQRDILIKLGYFEEFGGSQYLLDLVDIYEKFNDIKQIKKDKIHKLGLNMDLVEEVSGKETAKLYKEIDNPKLIKILSSKLEDRNISLMDRIACEIEMIGDIQYVNENIGYGIYYVKEFKTYKDKTKPYLMLYELASGKNVKTKIKDGKYFASRPFGQGSILKVDILNGFYNDYKRKKVNDKWIKTDEVEPILKEYDTYE